MAIFKRGRIYWYHFVFNGAHVQKTTKQGNPRVARQIEAAHRTALAKGQVGIVERKLAPVMKDFSQRFIDAIQVRCAEKPQTIRFYAEKLSRLLEFEPLASSRIDDIDESLIESYVQHRRSTVGPGTVNRQLATLRRLLRLAYEWKVIDRVPRIRLLPGERTREFVLNRAQEKLYLQAAPQPLRDLAILLLDTGLRAGEALQLEWHDVHLEPVNGARFGYIRVRRGKSKTSQRNLPLTDRIRATLAARAPLGQSPYVFASDSGNPYLVTSLDHLHSRIRALLRLPQDCVLHSLRHTYGTRLGECGADAFTIMKLMGHSSVTVSQRYVHPSPETMERAVERLQALNADNDLHKLSIGPKQQLPATILATRSIFPTVSPVGPVAQLVRAADS